MASNGFGTIFRITTWGESHGSQIGVTIDGCPAGVLLSVEDLLPSLAKRAPGQSSLVTPRKETDFPQIVSGVFQGATTGAPITIIIQNQQHSPQAYDELAHLLRPSHAGFAYLSKYGIYDYQGGGRASARETACRVAAGAVAGKILQMQNIVCKAFVCQIGHVIASDFACLDNRDKNPVNCPDLDASLHMIQLLEQLKHEGDSVGGVVGFQIEGVPPGIGDPIYEKLEAKLAAAMLSIPASKGFEIGQGFQSAYFKGSEHNDPFILKEGKVAVESNHAGGILGGISTGEVITGKVAFKPPSSIKKEQKTVSLEGTPLTYTLSSAARHDPCVAIRAVAVVEAMINLVIVDSWLMNRCAKL